MGRWPFEGRNEQIEKKNDVSLMALIPYKDRECLCCNAIFPLIFTSKYIHDLQRTVANVIP
jgi:hypothetical protein